ncbi:hypothetical protein HAX54_030458 [Datura stramonium]|uniref:Reverse transcriptase n=1 Tax=Datura stramonium TaxID=4076 RepID=A0ABS8VAK3_DATST|nr:hypothetical protein [Datura stramonium]
MKSFSFTTLDEPLANRIERLRAKGLLQPKRGFIPKHPSPNFDLSKICTYHSNVQGHDTENCPALRFKIQRYIGAHAGFDLNITKTQIPPTVKIGAASQMAYYSFNKKQKLKLQAIFT